MPYSIGEEIFNSISHGIGAIFGIVALVLMIIFCVFNGGEAIDIVGICIYGSSLIILYTMSTLYHAITNKKAKSILRIIDHSSIYILISGSITPYIFSILTDNLKKWTAFGFIWGVTVVGILLYAIFKEKVKIFNILSYIVLGWSVITIFPELISAFNAKNIMCCLWLLLYGGISYTVGVIFYAIKKVPYFHSIRHLFVLAGSILHFISMMIYICN